MVDSKNKDIKKLVENNESLETQSVHLSNKYGNILAKFALNYEKSLQREEFMKLQILKNEWGYPRIFNQARSFEDWNDGFKLSELKLENQRLKQKIENIEDEKKSRRRKKENDSFDSQENLKLILANLSKQLEENEIKLSESHANKYKIIYYERLLDYSSKCYFAKRNIENGLQAWPLLHNRYQVLRLLGKGGFSEVYKAFDVVSNKYVALKHHIMNSLWDNEFISSFITHSLRENNVFKIMDCSNIVKYYNSFEIDNMSFLSVIEYVEGYDLDFQIKSYGALPEKFCKSIIRQVIKAIKYLSEQTPKIIHYDLKPQNILLTKENQVKLTDFGLCKLIEDGQTKIDLTSHEAGTYWYLPPECFENGINKPKISSKVDVWSIGVILYQMLYGKKPFANDMSQERILKEKAILRSGKVNFPEKPNVSGELKEFIKSCLVHNQNDRMDIASAHVAFSKIN